MRPGAVGPVDVDRRLSHLQFHGQAAHDESLAGVGVSLALFVYLLRSVDLPELGRQLALTQWWWVVPAAAVGEEERARHAADAQAA